MSAMRLRNRKVLVRLIWGSAASLFGIVGCSGEQASFDSARKAMPTAAEPAAVGSTADAAPQPTSTTEPQPSSTPSSQSATSTSPEPPKDRQEEECLAHWRSVGVSNEALQDYEEVPVDVSFSSQTNSTVVFEDLTPTATERFLVVTLTGQNMNSAEAILSNPNGRYCFYFKSKNANGFVFKKHPSASLHALSMDYQRANNFQVLNITE